MQLEDQVFWKKTVIPPDNPPNASVDKTKFVAAGIDRLHSWKFEIPFEARFCMSKRGDEATRGSLQSHSKFKTVKITAVAYIDVYIN